MLQGQQLLLASLDYVEQVVTSAHYLLSDLYIADDINAVLPEGSDDNDDTESENSEQV